MGEYKLGDPSLPFRTLSRSGKTTILPLRRSTRPKKPPDRFSSTRVQMENIIHTEIGATEKAEEDNQSSAKIKLIRKMGKWVMHDKHGGNNSKRFKSNRHGQGKTNRHGQGEVNRHRESEANRHGQGEANRHREGEANRHGEGDANRHEGMNNNYKGNGHDGAPFDRNVNNNSKGRNSYSEVNVNLKNIDDGFNNIHCEQVPFYKLVPPVPAEETVCEELRQPSPERFVTYLDHDYAIPRTRGVRFKGYQKTEHATKERELQYEDEVEIIGEIPVIERKSNETEMKEEIEDFAETTEELKLQDDEVEIIGEISAGVLKINETVKKEDTDDFAEASIPQSASQESEPQNVDEIEDLAEASISSVTNEELSTTESMNKHANVAQNIIEGGCYLNEVTGCFQNIVKEESEPENKDEVLTVSETVAYNVNTESMQTLEYPDEIVKSGSLGEDEAMDSSQVGEHGRHSVDEARERRGHVVWETGEHGRHVVWETGEHRRHGVNEQREHRRCGVNEQREHRRHGVNEQREHRRCGVDEEAGEHKRHSMGEAGEYRRQGMEEAREHRRHGVNEAREHRRHGVDEAREHRQQDVDEGEERRQGVEEVRGHRQQDVGCCGACRRNDKIKIKMEIEMSTEQFLQVAKEMPNIVTDVNVHSS